ncbi:MAG: hypothetical protein HQL40_08575 [Alphaproteobacteria bacterium]|nr:hypothetical protein [Alphaproteobacteria bacterium]
MARRHENPEIGRKTPPLEYIIAALLKAPLILWLATRAADPAFVSNEGAKLSKLVEAANADRPIPLVSVVARQRDLRELVGDTLTLGNFQSVLSGSIHPALTAGQGVKIARRFPHCPRQLVLASI